MTFAGIFAIITSITTVIGGLISIYKAIKAKEFSQALTLSDETLRTIIASIESLPQSDNTTALKQRIQAVAEATGVQVSKLAPVVADIEALFRDNGLPPIAEISQDGSTVDIIPSMQRQQEAVSTSRANRAAAAILKTRAAQAKRRPVTTSPDLRLPFLLLLMVPLLFALGCAPVAPTRLAVETLWPATAADPAELVIVWPRGVQAADLQTHEIDGRTITTAPIYTPSRPRPQLSATPGQEWIYVVEDNSLLKLP